MRMRATWLWAFCMLYIALPAVAQQAAPALTVIGAEKAAEPDEKGNVTLNLTIRNTAKANTPLRLLIEPFASELDTPVRAKAAFTPAALPAELEPNQSVSVQLTVQAKWPAGMSAANLRNGDTTIATIHVDQEPVFNVVPAGWSETAPLTIRMESGSPAYLRLNNPDDVPWLVQWTLDAGQKSATDIIALAPRQQRASIAIPYDADWFPKSTQLRTLFRDEDQPAKLSLVALRRGRKPDVLWATREIDVTLQRSYWSAVGRDWVGSIVLILVLVAGGASSLFVTNFLPNWRRKSALLKRLVRITRAARALPDEVASLARVRARVDAQQLRNEITPRWALSSDFADFVKICEEEASRLDQRVQMLEEIGAGIEAIDTAARFAPTQLSTAFDKLGNAQRLLSNNRPKEATLACARTAIDAAMGTLQNIESPSEEMKKALAARVTRAIGLLTQRAIADVAEADVSTHVSTTYADPSAITADNFASIDAAVTKVELVAHFVATAGVNDADLLRDFKALLSSNEYEAFRAARMLVFHAKQQAATQLLTDALERGAFDLEVEPPSVDVSQSAMFKVVCSDSAALNTHAARFGVDCDWDFGDGTTEKGWEVAHDYRTRGTYEVKVTFRKKGNVLANVPVEKASTTVVVAAEKSDQLIGDETKFDLARLAILMGLAILGLLAGAKEQIAKVDLLPGLVAVFTLGFSADQIKNVLAPKN